MTGGEGRNEFRHDVGVVAGAAGGGHCGLVRALSGAVEHGRAAIAAVRLLAGHFGRCVVLLLVRGSAGIFHAVPPAAAQTCV